MPIRCATSGCKDITAHVDFTAIALAAQEAGAEVIGYTSQARFLLNCGLAGLLEQADSAERAHALRLVNEHEMGELFKVLAFATGCARRLRAGGDRLRRRRPEPHAVIRWLIVVFVALLIFNGFHRWLEKIGLGRLPGDFRFRIFGREILPAVCQRGADQPDRAADRQVLLISGAEAGLDRGHLRLLRSPRRSPGPL